MESNGSVVVIIGKETLAPEFRGLLGDRGPWRIRWAPGVTEASDLLDKGALIVLDFELDPVAPATLLERLQRIKGVSDIPVLLVGSKSEEASMRRGVGLGADGYLIRPLAPDVLRDKVEEMIRAAGGRRELDAGLLTPFVEATRNVFKMMAGLDVKLTRQFLKRDHRLFGDITGIMGLHGRSTGSVAISMPAELACDLVGRILNQQPEPEIDDIVRDGMGEFINMIAGQACAAFAGSAYRFQVGLPAVVTGHGHTVAHRPGKDQAPCLVATFEALGRCFALQVSLAPGTETRVQGGRDGQNHG